MIDTTTRCSYSAPAHTDRAMKARPILNAAKRALTTAALAVIVVVLSAAPSLAHVDLADARPAPEGTRTKPVRVVSLTFTNEAEPAGPGIEFLLPDGSVTGADRLRSQDGVVWKAEFDEPLPAGTIGVRWTMRAGDAHPRTGAFSFDIRLPKTEGETSATLGPSPPESTPGIDEFLEPTAAGGAAGRLGALGRVLSMAGIVLGVGALAFAATALRGSADDIRYSVFWIRRLGLVAAAGASIELVAAIAGRSGAVSIVNPLSYVSLLTTGPGLAIAMRASSGYGMTAFARLAAKSAGTGVDVITAVASRIPVGVGPAKPLPELLSHLDAPASVRLDRTASHRAFLAAAVGLASFALDGHTLTEGTYAFTAFAGSLHAGAAAVWAGGVLMLALVAHRRRWRGESSDLLGLAVRFSVVASISVVAVGVAGLILTFTIIQDVSALWSTSWGQLLLAKLALVAAAGVMGFHNHRTLIPRYLDSPDSGGLRDQLLRAVTIEASILVGVVALTAFLVGAGAV